MKPVMFHPPAIRRGIRFYLLLTLLACNCTYTYHIEVIPQDATVNIAGTASVVPVEYRTSEGKITVSASRDGYEDFKAAYRHNNPFKVQEIRLTLTPLFYNILLETIESPSSFTIDDTYSGVTPAELLLSHGQHTVRLQREGYPPQIFDLEITKPGKHLFRHQKEETRLQPLGIFSCGHQPKQVNFSPDNRYLVSDP